VGEFFRENSGTVGSRAGSRRESANEKGRHSRFTYRFNNRGSLCAAVFEWLIRCSQPFGRRAMLLEVIFQLLPRASALFHLVLATFRGRFMRLRLLPHITGCTSRPRKCITQLCSHRARESASTMPRALGRVHCSLLQRLVLFTTIPSIPSRRPRRLIPIRGQDRAIPKVEFRQREN